MSRTRRPSGDVIILRAGGQPAIARLVVRGKNESIAGTNFAHRPLFQPIIKKPTVLGAAARAPVGKMVLATKIARDRAARPPDFHYQPIIRHKLPANVGSPQPIGRQVMVTTVSRDRAARPPDYHFRATYLTFKPSGMQVIRWWIKT